MGHLEFRKFKRNQMFIIVHEMFVKILRWMRCCKQFICKSHLNHFRSSDRIFIEHLSNWANFIGHYRNLSDYYRSFAPLSSFFHPVLIFLVIRIINLIDYSVHGPDMVRPRFKPSTGRIRSKDVSQIWSLGDLDWKNKLIKKTAASNERLLKNKFALFNH